MDISAGTREAYLIRFLELRAAFRANKANRRTVYCSVCRFVLKIFFRQGRIEREFAAIQTTQMINAHAGLFIFGCNRRLAAFGGTDQYTKRIFKGSCPLVHVFQLRHLIIFILAELLFIAV